jgi:beta-galactosidase
MQESGIGRREFLGGLAALPLPLPMTGAAPPAAVLLDQVRVGAEFFLNATETRETVFEHFRRMRETGLTIARIFTLWDQVERVRGVWNFERYDWVYDAAAQNGILIANTLCSEDPPGWMQTAPFYHQWQDLKNPILRPHAQVYLDKVVNHYKSHRAHGVWLLQNEPGISGKANEPYVLADFAAWLEKKYGSVEELNKLWYRPLERFADVTVPVDARSVGWSDYPSQLDWLRFRCDHLAAQLQWIRGEVLRHHPGALTHINPPGLTGNMPASGRDMWKMKPAAHFMGASMHAAWHFGMFARQDFGVAYGYCCDLIRSASAPAPWWVTELQGGTTVFTGSRPLNPTSAEITHWLWDGIGNGSRGIVFWLWHPRTEGNEAGEWALAGPSGEETERTRAARGVTQVLEQHKELFRDAKPVAARVAILYPRDAMLLYAVDGWRRPADEVVHSMMGCYKALHRAHVPVDFLDVSELEAGAAAKYKVLYLPYCYALSAASCQAIREFVRAGGSVWADGLVAWKDEGGVTKRFPPGPLSDVFGFTVEDIQPVWEPFSLTSGGDKGGELWRCVVPGYPGSVVEKTFGKGRAIYYGTALTLGYLRRDNAQVADWIARPAIEASRDLPVRLGAGTGLVSLRVMQAGRRLLAILNNWGAEASLNLQIPPGAAVTDLLTSTRGTPATLKAGGAAVLLIEPG